MGPGGENLDSAPDHAGQGDGVMQELASFQFVQEGAGNDNLVNVSVHLSFL